jgi:hypothetical protein
VVELLISGIKDAAFYEPRVWSLTAKTQDRDFGDGRLRQLAQYASPA